MEFFITGVAETAEQAAGTAHALITMFDTHRQQIAGLGRAAPSALSVHELMQASPIVTIQTISKKLAVSFPTANTALEILTKLNFVRETTGRQRGKNLRLFGLSGLAGSRRRPVTKLGSKRFQTATVSPHRCSCRRRLRALPTIVTCVPSWRSPSHSWRSVVRGGQHGFLYSTLNPGPETIPIM